MNEQDLDEVLALRDHIKKVEKRSHHWDRRLGEAIAMEAASKAELARLRAALTAKLAALTNGPQS